MKKEKKNNVEWGYKGVCFHNGRVGDIKWEVAALIANSDGISERVDYVVTVVRSVAAVDGKFCNLMCWKLKA